MNFWLRLVLTVAYFAVIGVLSNLIGEKLPRRWFRPDAFFFRLRKWERGGKIYRAVEVHRWKDHVPDMSKINRKMVPKRIGKVAKSAQVHRLVIETCVAEATHTVLCLLGVAVIFFWDSFVGVLFAGCYILANIPFILIQRYNRPMLMSLAERLEVREERKRNAIVNFVGEYGRRS